MCKSDLMEATVDSKVEQARRAVSQLRVPGFPYVESCSGFPMVRFGSDETRVMVSVEDPSGATFMRLADDGGSFVVVAFGRLLEPCRVGSMEPVGFTRAEAGALTVAFLGAQEALA